MEKIKYLLKFGKREHIEAFAKGAMYCSNAQTFWNIEKELAIKGQGDKLEASSRFFADRMTVYNNADMSFVAEIQATSGIVHYEPAEKLPVFCLFAVFEKDCVNKGMADTIRLSEKIKKTIMRHFPNADAVAIITDPEAFLDDVSRSVGSGIKHGLVNYFRIADGYVSKDGKRSLDMDYMKYLTQDEPPVVNGKYKQYRFLEKHVYRALFCKDIYFEDEQEYRIVLNEEEIVSGTVYTVNLNQEICVMSLMDFFNGM